VLITPPPNHVPPKQTPSFPLPKFEPLHFGFESKFLKKSAAVKVTPEGFQIAELSLLILIGWYLMILRSDDDGAVLGVVCAAT
jgi:hypothetical protein